MKVRAPGFRIRSSNHVAFSPDGSHLAVVGRDVVLWNGWGRRPRLQHPAAITDMTIRQFLWFIGAYAAIVALAVWFNLAVLCQGAAQYDQGCGGFAMYIPLWEMFLAPLPIAAILLERWRTSAPPPTPRLLAYLAGILIVAEIGWLVLDTFPALLAAEAVAIGIAVFVRSRTAQRGMTPRTPVA